MLRRFLYLDEVALESYLSAIEGGLSDEARHRREHQQGRSGSAGARAGPFTGEFSRGNGASMEDERVVRETPESRIDRLLSALEEDPETWRYEHVLDLEDAFDRLPVGYMMRIDCELEIPPSVQLLAEPERANDMFDMIEAMRPAAGLLGQSADELPDADQVTAMRGMLGAMRSDLVVVGDQAPDGPSIAGRLNREYLRDSPEGEATVVGKVAKRWDEGTSHSLVALPGASLLTRRQRREGGIGGDEDQLHGPALTVDVLAIYR